MTAPPLYLLDTNILVHLVRGDATWARIRAAYQLLLADPVPLISVVSVGELRSLALQFNWGKAKLDQMGFCLEHFRRVSIDDPDIIQAYAVIDAHTQRIGHPMGKNDCWIAATASILKARLITTDTDFHSLDPLFLSRDWIDPSVGAE